MPPLLLGKRDRNAGQGLAGAGSPRYGGATAGKKTCILSPSGGDAPRKQEEDELGNSGLAEEPRDEPIIHLLARGLGPEFVSDRQGPGNTTLSYLKTEDCIELLNWVFTPRGWSSEIIAGGERPTLEQDATGKYVAHAWCRVRITVRWPLGWMNSHDGSGYGGGKPIKT